MLRWTKEQNTICAFLICWAAFMLVGLAFWGVVVYCALHFIFKFW